MKVVTVRDFRDHATEMFRSDDVILVTREGTPAGVLPPVGHARAAGGGSPRGLPAPLRADRRASSRRKGVSESEVLGDFAASRSRR